MSMRYKGAILSTITPTANNTSAVGIWSKRSQMQAIATSIPYISTGNANKYLATGTFSNPSFMNNSTNIYKMAAVISRPSDGLFVSIGVDDSYYPVYATSTNGSTWTTPVAMHTTGFYNNFSTLTCRQSDGLFVSTGYSGNFYAVSTTSTNGSTWTTPANISYNINLASITCRYSDGLFVAVGNFGAYSISTNGSTWTSGNMNVNSLNRLYMRSVTCRQSDGLFVAVGYNEVSMYNPTVNCPYYSTSTNGSTWTAPALMNGSSPNIYINSVTCRQSDGLFVAVGSVTSDIYSIPAAYYATSTNGSTWTTPAKWITDYRPNTEGNIYPNKIIVNSSGLFIVSGLGQQGTAYGTSTNGSNWHISMPYADTNTIQIALSGLAVNDYTNVVAGVGYNRQINQPGYPMYTYMQIDMNNYSANTPALMNNSSANSAIQGVAVNSSGLFSAVGFNSSNYAVYATSTNGKTWTTPAVMNGINTAANISSVTCRQSDGLFVAVGSNSSNYAVYATSTNGSTWTTPAVMNGSTLTVTITAVTCRQSDGLFVAVGYYSSDPYGFYATSTNGSTWTTPAQMGMSVSSRITAVTVSNSGRFVAVGYNSSNSGVYSTSTTGSSWSTPAIISGISNLIGIAVNSSGLFVATAYAFSWYGGNEYTGYATSTNGTIWNTNQYLVANNSPYTESIFARFYGITTNNSDAFVAIGGVSGNYWDVTGVYYSTSTNGLYWINPIKISSDVNTSIRAVVANSTGDFVAVGSNGNGYPIYSTISKIPDVSSSTYVPAWPAAINPPVAPTIGTVIVDNNSVSIPFTAPIFTSTGVKITGYTATSNPGGVTSTINQGGSGIITMSGLSYSTSYTFTVYAQSYVGNSNNSNASTPIVTGIGMNAPTIINTSFGQLSAVTCRQSDGLFVAIGVNSNTYPVFTSSTNGSTWTTPAVMNGSNTAVSMTAIAVNNTSGLFVAVGYTAGASGYPVYATSTNGSTWTTPAAMNGYNGYCAINSVTRRQSDGLFVAIGWNSSGTPLYATSTNGSTWTTPAVVGATTTYGNLLTAVTVSSSGNFVAVGRYYNSGSYYPIYSTSTNGTTWTTPAQMVSGTGFQYAYLNSVTANSSGFCVTVGYDSNTYPIFASSTNGTTWNAPSKLNNTSSVKATLKAVTCRQSDGLFVAVGQDYAYLATYGVYSTSTNGLNWSTINKMNNTSTVSPLTAVTISNSGGVVAVGWDSNNYPIYTTSI